MTLTFSIHKTRGNHEWKPTLTGQPPSTVFSASAQFSPALMLPVSLKACALTPPPPPPIPRCQTYTKDISCTATLPNHSNVCPLCEEPLKVPQPAPGQGESAYLAATRGQHGSLQAGGGGGGALKTISRSGSQTACIGMKWI